MRFQVKVVMFDLDGTLIDSVPDLAAAVDTMLLSLGRQPAGIEAVREWVGNGAPVLVRRALAGGIDHSAVDDVEAEHALEVFMEAYGASHELTVVYPGVRDTLKWLQKQGVAMALITNKPERFVAPLLDQMKIGRYFKWIIGGDTLPQKKPDPAALEFAGRVATLTAIADYREHIEQLKGVLMDQYVLSKDAIFALLDERLIPSSAGSPSANLPDANGVALPAPPDCEAGA